MLTAVPVPLTAYDAGTVGNWVATAYQAAVKELISDGKE